MTKCISKRREMRTKLQSIHQELTKVSMERNYLLEEQDKRKKLEQELVACESEKMHLQNRLRDIENNKCLRTDVPNTVKPKETSPSILKISKEEETTSTDQTKVKKDRKTQKRAGHFSLEDSETNSPNIPVQSQGILALKEHYGTFRRGPRSTFNILNKKPRLSQHAMESMKSGMITYDGFGGHSKHDVFPNPVSKDKSTKLKEFLAKSKKPKLDAEDNQKLTNLVANAL